MLSITEDRVRIALAAYQFTGEAYQWWLSIEETRDLAVMTWKEFRGIFLKKFFPLAVRQAKAEEFFALTQGSDSVLKYEAKFTELSRFAKSAIADEADKARRFEKGLRPALRSRLSVLNLQTYDEVVERALLGEAEMNSQREQQRAAEGT